MPTTLHKTPAGVTLARVEAAGPMAVGRTEGDWLQVTLDGWMSAGSLRAQARDGFDLAVIARAGESLRAAPDGPVTAHVRYGALVDEVERRGAWVHVRRVGWVARSAVAAAREPGARADAPRAEPPKTTAARSPVGSRPAAYQAMRAQKPDTAAGRQASAGSPGDVDRVETAREAGVFLFPEGVQIGTLQSGTGARILSRSGEWVRVQTEGWVRDADLKPATGGALTGVSAAEVRANPDRYVGQTLDWRLQVVSLQTADELRPEMPSGQPYLLTRGPLPEPGFVYVMIPRDQTERFRSLGPLAELMLRVRIRAAHTRYLATPVAELIAVVDSGAATH